MDEAGNIPDMKAMAGLIDSLAADRAKAIVRLTAAAKREDGWKANDAGFNPKWISGNRNRRAIGTQSGLTPSEKWRCLLSNYHQVNRHQVSKWKQKSEELDRAYEQWNAWQLTLRDRILSRREIAEQTFTFAR